jgi:hypothetical protein
MVIAFYASDTISSAGIGVSTVLFAIFTLAAIGAVVGGIHGLALLWLVGHRRNDRF